jgi:hypothetical protein
MLHRVLNHSLRALRVDRSLYAELQFSNEAAGDALVAIFFVTLVPWIRSLFGGRVSLTGLISATLGTAIFWMITGGLLWVVGVKVLKGYGAVQNTLAIAGFAFLPFVVVQAVGSLVGDVVLPGSGTLFALAGYVWVGLGMALVAEVSLGLQKQQSAMAAAGALVGLVVLRALLF